MKVLNIMLTNTLGGIEQSFLDYSQALLVNHHQVISVVQPLSPIIKYIVKTLILLIVMLDQVKMLLIE